MNSLTKVQDPFLNFNDMEHFFQNWNDNFHRNGVRHIPAINVSKTKDGYELECAAPGLEKKDFKIDLDGSLITISATKKTNLKKKINTTAKENIIILPFLALLTYWKQLIRIKFPRNTKMGS